jgi:hypothetical protein
MRIWKTKMKTRIEKSTDNLYGLCDELVSKEGNKQSKPASVLIKEKLKRRKLNKINRRR